MSSMIDQFRQSMDTPGLEPTGDRLSMLDQFKQSINVEEPQAEEIPEVKGKEINLSAKADDFYSTTSLHEHLIMKELGKRGMGPEPAGGWDELNRPLNAEGKPYFVHSEPEGLGKIFADTLKGLRSLVTHPYEDVRGMADFILSIPGFLTGLGTAAQKGLNYIVEEIAEKGVPDITMQKYAKDFLEKTPSEFFAKVQENQFNALGFYNELSKGMHEGVMYYRPTIEKMIGVPTKESELVGQVAMAPLNALSYSFNQAAESEAFKNHPNIRGILKLTGDGLGLAVMGMLLHGGSTRQSTVERADTISNKAVEIDQKLRNLDGVPEGAIKEAQKKSIEIEAKQLDLEAQQFMKKFGEDVMVAEEMSRIYEDHARAKQLKPKSTKAGWLQDAIREKRRIKAAERRHQKQVEEGKVVPEEPKTKPKIIKKGEQEPEPAGKVTGETRINDVTMNRFMDMVIEGNEGIVAELESIVGIYGREGTQDLVNPGKVYARAIKQLVDKGVERKAAKEILAKPFNKYKKQYDTLMDDLAEIEALEYHYGKDISQISDKEIENFYVDKELASVEVDPTERTPEILYGDKSPWFQDKETTEQFKQIWSDPERQNSIRNDPELMTNKLANDMNRWYHGDKDVDVNRVRNMLSELATRADELRMTFFEESEPFLAWKEMVSDAAAWARELDRPKIKRSDVRLDFMIPFDTIPKNIFDYIKGIKSLWGKFKGTKADELKSMKGIDKHLDKEIRHYERSKIRFGDIYRNKELYDKTGFWLGRDGKWRYELPDEIKFPVEVYNKLKEGKPVPLDNIVQNDDIFKVFPELRKIKVVKDSSIDMKGQFSPSTNTITISTYSKDTMSHEVQHAINQAAGSHFLGTNTRFIQQLHNWEFLQDLRAAAKSSETKDIVDKIEANVLAGFAFDTYKSQLVNAAKDKAGSSGDFTEYRGILSALDKFAEKNAYDEYLADPGEMEARLASRRRHLTPEQKKAIPPWETLDLMLYNEGIATNTRASSLMAGQKLYSGIPVDEAVKLIADVIDKASKFHTQKLLDAIKHLNMKDITKSYVSEGELRKLGYEKEADAILGSIVTIAEGKGAEVREKIFTKIAKRYDGQRLYSNLPLDKAYNELIKGAKDVKNYMKEARGLKGFHPIKSMKEFRKEFNKTFIDRSGNIRVGMLDKLGDAGYRAVQRMYLALGGGAWSASKLRQMRKEVYRGLSKIEREVLDNVILVRRMLDIAGYKSASQFSFPKGLEPAKSAAYNELFPYIEKLSPERAAVISKKADAYSEWMKIPLKDLLDAELIKQSEFNDLSSHNYRRLKSIGDRIVGGDLVDIYDKRYGSKLGAKKRIVYDSGIESLQKGRKTNVLEPSSEVMALEVFNRTYGRILNNKANQALLEIARRDPENQFVRSREVEGTHIPAGWQRIFLYEGGERKTIHLSPDMAKEWVMRDPEMKHMTAKILGWIMGTPVLKTFATGINWGFAVANLPRDIMHLWFAARIREGDQWKGVYNPVLPIYATQITKDLATVFNDAALRKGRFNDYLEDGGGMELLVHQGRLFRRGKQVESGVDKVYNFMGYFGETSEILTRLAIRDRVIRKRAKQRGLSYEEAAKDKGIREEASFAARDYMDFNQGGGTTKALDHAIPYLGAAIQGTRGLFRSFKPGEGTAASSTFKLAQLAALTTGLYIAASKLSPKTMKQLKGNTAMQNNLCIPLGDQFGFVNDDGEMVYPYLKIPLDPGQKFFKTFFEAATDKWLGNEVDVEGVVRSLQEFSPVGTGELPPTVSGAVGYMSNKDFWLNKDIWRKTEKPFDYPDSAEEWDKDTPTFFKDVGQATGLSPERTKYAVEELVTSGTVWSYLLGQGYEKAFGDMPSSMKEQHLAEVLSKVPIAKRFIGVTNPYSQHASIINEAEQESMLDNWKVRRGFDTLVSGYLDSKTVRKDEVVKYIKGFKDVDIQDKLIENFAYQIQLKDLQNRAFWGRLKTLPPEARAKVYEKTMERADEDEKKALRQQLGAVMAAGGVVTDDFIDELRRLRNSSASDEID